MPQRNIFLWGCACSFQSLMATAEQTRSPGHGRAAHMGSMVNQTKLSCHGHQDVFASANRTTFTWETSSPFYTGQTVEVWQSQNCQSQARTEVWAIHSLLCHTSHEPKHIKNIFPSTCTFKWAAVVHVIVSGLQQVEQEGKVSGALS